MNTNSFEEINDMLGNIIGGNASQNPFSFSLKNNLDDEGKSICNSICSKGCSKFSLGSINGTIHGTEYPTTKSPK